MRRNGRNAFVKLILNPIRHIYSSSGHGQHGRRGPKGSSLEEASRGLLTRQGVGITRQVVRLRDNGGEGDDAAPAAVAGVLERGVLAGHALPVVTVVAATHGDVECLAAVERRLGREEGAQSACVGGLGERDGGGC
jgi:hypothetical protein